MRDGKSFVSRQVRAIQHGRVIFSAMVSFANPEEGLNYQHPEPYYPAPEALKSESELKEGILNFVPENVRASFMRERHVEIRPIDPVNPFQPQPEAPFNAHYIRTHDRIPKQLDDISLHQAIVAFYSDFTLMTTALRPHGLSYISQVCNVPVLIMRFISIAHFVLMNGCSMTWKLQLVRLLAV